MRRWAFTLIEVMAVVTLMGLLAGATAWSLAEDARRSSRANLVGRISHADAMARQAAQRFGRACMLRIDLDRQCIRRLTAAGERSVQSDHSLKVSAGCRIDRVAVAAAAGDAAGGPIGTRVDAGTIDIPYSPGGRSASFAVRLAFEGRGRDVEKSIGSELEGRSAWLVFAGLTGQMTVVHDEDELDNVLAMLASDRPDAH